MSYQPPSNPPEGGQPTRDMSSPGPTGDYTPPPTSGGGYTPPPAGDAYTPPPSPPAGGYAPPPPSGGYTPPPPGGGYSAPPPPPPPIGMGGGGMGSMGGGAGGASGAFNFQDLLQSWIGAVTKPNAAFYESEMPKANWMKTGAGIALATIVAIVLGLIAAPAAADRAAQNASQLQQVFGNQNVPSYLNFTSTSTSAGAAFLNIFWVPLFFFVGSAILFGLAKILGGQGSDFMTHSYLISLPWTPIHILGSVLGLGSIAGTAVGGITGLVVLALFLYRQYSQGKALEASQRMAQGKAQLAAFLPVIVPIVLVCLCLVLGVLIGVSILSGTSTR